MTAQKQVTCDLAVRVINRWTSKTKALGASGITRVQIGIPKSIQFITILIKSSCAHWLWFAGFHFSNFLTFWTNKTPKFQTTGQKLQQPQSSRFRTERLPGHSARLLRGHYDEVTSISATLSRFGQDTIPSTTSYFTKIPEKSVTLTVESTMCREESAMRRTVIVSRLLWS